MVSTEPVTQEVDFDSCARKLQRISFETFPRKTYFTWFPKFIYNILSKIVWENIFSFLTGEESLEFIFWKYFKRLIVLKIDI